LPEAERHRLLLDQLADRLGPLLRRPFGRVHWAGTETATVSHGAVDGAIRSGERAAAEVLEGEGP
jgi:monoamine oxidase